MAGLTYRRHKLLEDLVEPLSVLGDCGTAADVQGELAQWENITSAVPVQEKKKHCGVIKVSSECSMKNFSKFQSGIHIRDEMQHEVLCSQSVSQQDVGEVREQLGSDGGHLAQRGGQNWGGGTV